MKTPTERMIIPGTTEAMGMSNYRVVMIPKADGSESNTGIILDGLDKGSIIVRQGYGGNGKDPNCDQARLNYLLYGTRRVN